MIKLNKVNKENRCVGAITNRPKHNKNQFVGALIKRPNGITLISLVITIVLNTFCVVVVNK